MCIRDRVVGDKVDGRSDIFSLGAVLYEILTGHPPFAGDDLNAILYQVLNTAPPLPTLFNPGLPPGFDRIVARAMAKKAGKRYQNAYEMSVDLRNSRRISGLSKKAPHTDGNVKITPLKMCIRDRANAGWPQFFHCPACAKSAAEPRY